MTNALNAFANASPHALLTNVVEVGQYLLRVGTPFPAKVQQLLASARSSFDAAVEVDRLLQPMTLVRLRLDAGGYATAERGSAEPILIEQGWCYFLVRIENPSGIQRALVHSHELGLASWTSMGSGAIQQHLFDRIDKSGMVESTWLLSDTPNSSPLTGSPLEYRVLALFSRDRGPRSTYLAFTCGLGGGAVDHGRQGVHLDFECLPTREISLDVRDHDGSSCMASVVVRDSTGRVFPPRKMRLAPDMYFHDHIYRATGERLRLPDGRYEVTAWRGPEYRATLTEAAVDGSVDSFGIMLDRWVDPSSWGYYSGDPHIHASGCSHYSFPTEGVAPETMIRHVRGEALNVGSVLTWGPGHYYQRQFFSGQSISPAAELEHPTLQNAQGYVWETRPTDRDAASLLRYDLEVSGFPSSHSGHPVLVGLKDQVYPGGEDIHDWPSWNLPILRWAKDQGAATGYAHCSLGMGVDDYELPNDLIPSFNSIGMNEAIVDVTFGVLDFLSGAEELPAQEMNGWYHVLNAGYQLRMVGETDYPCIFEERPGVGRTYVALPHAPSLPDGVERWLDGVRTAPLYFGDGRSHLFNLSVVGGRRRDGSVVAVQAVGHVEVSVTVAALLEETLSEATAQILRTPPYATPAWHLERARIHGTREVPVELIVNGATVASQRIVADGEPHVITFGVDIDRSCWIAIRVVPSVHSEPVFLDVRGQPFIPIGRSLDWCRAAIGALWKEKSRFIRQEERGDAEDAYRAASAEYEARRTKGITWAPVRLR